MLPLSWITLYLRNYIKIKLELQGIIQSVCVRLSTSSVAYCLVTMAMQLEMPSESRSRYFRLVAFAPPVSFFSMICTTKYWSLQLVSLLLAQVVIVCKAFFVRNFTVGISAVC